MIEGQIQHLALAVLLSVGALDLLNTDAHAGTVLGLTSGGWARVSIALALLHQWLVAAVFRLQLHHNLMSRLFGQRDLAIWAALFLPLLAARPITVILCGWADAGQLGLPHPVRVATGIVLLAISLWAMHSVLVHFTIRRALGGDHFRDEIAALPLVDRGAFRYSANAMYGLVFLGLWGIALLLDSWNALVLALFQHAYIWVHMYCTEQPDMDWIYRRR